MTYLRNADNSLKTETLTLPAHWASALINSDESGMTDEESTELAEWVADRPELGECLSCSDYPEFMTRNDAGTLADDCLEFTFPLLAQVPQ